MSSGTSNVVSEQTVIAGGSTSNSCYRLYFNFSTTDANNPLVAHDMLQGRLRRIAASTDEVTGEIGVWDWASVWKTDKIFGTWAVETNVT